MPGRRVSIEGEGSGFYQKERTRWSRRFQEPERLTDALNHSGEA